MHSCKSTLRLMLGKLLVRHQMKVNMSHLIVVVGQSAVAASNMGLEVATLCCPGIAPMLSCITALANGAIVCTVLCTCCSEAKVLSAAYCFSCLAECVYNIAHSCLKHTLKSRKSWQKWLFHTAYAQPLALVSQCW